MVRSIAKVLSKRTEPAPAQREGAPAEQTVTAATIRVESVRLDRLVDLVGELVIIQSRLQQTAITQGDAQTRTIAEELERTVGRLRDETLRIRMREIVNLSETTTDQVRSIATASEEQSSASEEINRNIEDVNRISLETTDAMRQSAQAVTELANQAQVLKRLIGEMESGDGADAAALPSGKKVLALGRVS